MKFIAQLMIGLLLSLSLTGLVSAQDEASFNSDDGVFQNLQDAAQDRMEEEGVGFEQAKDAEVALIEAAITRLEIMQSNLGAADVIHPETKKIVSDALEEVMENLEVQKGLVNDADDFDELEKVNDEWVDLLNDSRDEIRAAVEEAMLVVAENARDTFYELLDKLGEHVESLDENCDSTHQDEAEDLQDDYADFEAELKELDAAIKSEDANDAKVHAMELADLASSMVIQLNQLWPYCEHPEMESYM